MSDLRRHPVYTLLEAAALGELPREDALDQLNLPPAKRRAVSDAAIVAASLKAGGDNQSARKRAREAASEIIAALPADQPS